MEDRLCWLNRAWVLAKVGLLAADDGFLCVRVLSQAEGQENCPCDLVAHAFPLSYARCWSAAIGFCDLTTVEQDEGGRCRSRTAHAFAHMGFPSRSGRGVRNPMSSRSPTRRIEPSWADGPDSTTRWLRKGRRRTSWPSAIHRLAPTERAALTGSWQRVRTTMHRWRRGSGSPPPNFRSTSSSLRSILRAKEEGGPTTTAAAQLISTAI